MNGLMVYWISVVLHVFIFELIETIFLKKKSMILLILLSTLYALMVAVCWYWFLKDLIVRA